MPATNTERSASAPKAPHQAVDAAKRDAATASSARGSSSPRGTARAEGIPKSTMARREPSRSASLATPATAKTSASSSRATSRKLSIFGEERFRSSSSFYRALSQSRLGLDYAQRGHGLNMGANTGTGTVR